MNKAFLIGNLTRDPELKKTPNDISVCTFTIAVNRRFPSSSGEREVDFLPIVTWKGIADNCSKYLSKGKKNAVIGEIRTRSYQTKQGSTKHVTEIQAEDVQFLNPKNSENESNNIADILEDFNPTDEDLPF